MLEVKEDPKQIVKIIVNEKVQSKEAAPEISFEQLVEEMFKQEEDVLAWIKVNGRTVDEKLQLSYIYGSKVAEINTTNALVVRAGKIAPGLA